MADQNRRTLQSRTSSTSSHAITPSSPPSATPSLSARGHAKATTPTAPKNAIPKTAPAEEDKPSRFPPLQEEQTDEAATPAGNGDAIAHSQPKTPVLDTSSAHDATKPKGTADINDAARASPGEASSPVPGVAPSAGADVGEAIAAPSPSLPDDPVYAANPSRAWAGLLASMNGEPLAAPSPRPTREEVMQAAASGDINMLMKLLEKYTTKEDVSPPVVPPPDLSATFSTPTPDVATPLPVSDRGTKRAAAPADPLGDAGSQKRNRADQTPGEDIADLYDDLDGPGADLAAGRESLERIMRSVQDRDPDAVARHLGDNMQVLQYGLELIEREEAQDLRSQQGVRELTPAITPLARAMGAGLFPALAAPHTAGPAAAGPPQANEPAHAAQQGLRVVTAGSTPGPHPFPAGITAHTFLRGMAPDCAERWKMHRGLLLIGSQMHRDNGPANTNAATKAVRAYMPDLGFTIWTATAAANGLPPPPNVAVYFLRTDNEEAIARLTTDVHLIFPHINLTFLPIDRGLHPGKTWYTNIDGLGLPVVDVWIQNDILEAIKDILRNDQVLRAMIIARRDNIPNEIANEDAPDYIVDSIRVCPLRLALPGGTTFNYAIRVFGIPPTMDVGAFQQIQAHMYGMAYTTAYGTGYAHLFDVCGVCTALDHPRGLCPLPSIPGYLGPLPGRELNPAAVASEALVDPVLAIGHAHLIGIRTGINADVQPGAAAPGLPPPIQYGGQWSTNQRGGRGGRGGFQRGRGGARGAARGSGRGRGGNFSFIF